MGFDAGRLVFDNDTGVYYTGQTLFGKLIFDQEKKKTFRGIYVKLKGYCYVHWRTSHTRRVNGKTETYYVDHTSREEYTNQKTYLVGNEHGEMSISAGHYEYSFQFVIPSNCPSSYEGDHGHIRYEVKAVVDRALKFDQEKKASIRVIEALDLNTEPGVKDPVHIKFDESYYCCCTRSGSVTAAVKLPYRGYIPGQTIPIELECDNTGSVTIDSITFTLKKDTKFHAQGTKSSSEDVARVQLGEVPAGTTRSWTAELLVPHVNTPNVRNCRYIDVDYRIKVTLSPDGCHSNSSQSRDLVIGTIPIVGTEYPSGGPDQIVHHNVPVVNQPLPSQYPGGSPYPSNTPYPGPLVTPYPNVNTPYPVTNDHSSYPPPYTVTPSGNDLAPTPYPISNIPSEKAPYPGGPNVSPYPNSNSPYPTSNTPSEKLPYPGGATVSPYPTANSPYQTSNAPYPTINSPYPTANMPPTNCPYPSTAPYPNSPSPFPPPSAATPNLEGNSASTGLRTGTFGFIPQGSVNKTTMPQLPPGVSPYPSSPSPNPFAAASAPQPGSPDDEPNKQNLI